MNAKSKLKTGVYHHKLVETPEKLFEENAVTHLKQAGFRITMPRIQVIRALATTKSALSAYEIHEKILEDGGRIDVVSVYRILNTLQEVGLIHKVGVANGYFPSLKGPSSEKSSLIIFENPSELVHELDFPSDLAEKIRGVASSAGFTPQAIKIEIVSYPIK